MDDFDIFLPALSGGMMGTSFFVAIFLMLCNCRLYRKAGRQWWESLIPLFNTYVQFEIIYGQGHGLRFLFLFIPIVNIFVWIKFQLDWCHAYGYGTAFGILSCIFPVITTPIMAFSDSYYAGPQ